MLKWISKLQTYKTLKITMMAYVLEVALPFNSRQVY